MPDHAHPLRSVNPPLTGIAARLVHGASWNLVGAVFNQGSTFLVNVVLANLWGVQAFGRYAIVQSTVATLVHVSQLATGYTATRYVAQYRVANKARASRLMALCASIAALAGLLGAAALVAGASVFADRLFGDRTLATALRIGGLAVFPGVLNGYMAGALAGLEGYRVLGRVGVLSGALYAATCATGGWLGGLHGAVAGIAGSATLQAVLLRRALMDEARQQQIALKLAGAFRETQALFTFAIPAALNGFGYLPAVWLSNAMLTRQPGGFQEMAIFAAANNFRMLALFVPAIVNNVGMSLLNNQRGTGDERRFRRVFWMNLGLTALVSLGGAAVMGGLAPWLLRSFGSGFVVGSPVLLVLLAAAVPETLTLSVLHPVQNQDRVWLVSGTVILPCYATIVLCARLWIPETGALGLAWAYLAGWSLALLSSSALAWRLGLWKQTP